jgi:hypothetical protein
LVFVAGYFNSLGTTSVNEETGNLLPGGFYLEQNFPNPFNPETTIIYSVPYETEIKLKVYNSIGEEIITLVDELKNAGTYKIFFRSSDLSSGIYFLELSSENYISTRKMILIK